MPSIEWNKGIQAFKNMPVYWLVIQNRFYILSPTKEDFNLRISFLAANLRVHLTFWIWISDILRVQNPQKLPGLKFRKNAFYTRVFSFQEQLLGLRISKSSLSVNSDLVEAVCQWNGLKTTLILEINRKFNPFAAAILVLQFWLRINNLLLWL
jgi:hypothetical protein